MSDWFDRNLDSYNYTSFSRSGNRCGTVESFQPLSIVGGEDINAAKDWMVSIQKNGNHFCGGMLVAPKWVLSASHCSKGQNTDLWTVNIGGVNLKNQKEFETFKVKRKIEPPGDKPDMVLLELDGTPKLSKPMLINSNNNLPAGMDVTAIGWGKLGETKGQPDILQTVDLPLISDAECAKAYPGTFKSDIEICAGFPEGGQDACQGDSGGPLFVTTDIGDILIGATSWGEGCARARKYGVWTRLANHLDWLKSHAPIITADVVTAKKDPSTAALDVAAEDVENEDPETCELFQKIIDFINKHKIVIVILIVIFLIIKNKK